jgi:hypothetical protein
MGVNAALSVEMEFSGAGGGWTDVTADVLAKGRLSIRRGMRGNGVHDLVATVGTCSFLLNNSPKNSASTLGYYSPDHASKRSGWALGIGVRVTVTYDGDDEVQFVGWVNRIRARPGFGGTQGVEVTCVDWMAEAAKFEIRDIATQVDVRADQLMTTLVTAVPRQPTSTDFDTTTDVYEFALESVGNVEGGKTDLLSEFSRVAHSEFGRIFVKRDGALKLESRATRFANAAGSQLTATNSMIDLQPDHSADAVVNYVLATAFPRRSDDNLAVLWEMSADVPQFIAPSSSVTFRADYVKADEKSTHIGATDVQDPVAAIDYAASVTNVVAAPIPDAFAELAPSGQGNYSNFSLGAGASKTVAMSDDDDATYITPVAAAQYETFALDNLPSTAADAAPVAYVEVFARIKQNDTIGWCVFYPILRANGIDLQGTAVSHDDGVTDSGYLDVTQKFLTDPSGAPWTVATVNGLEIGGWFNWNSAAPGLHKLRGRVVYAGLATTSSVDDMTSEVSVVITKGATSAKLVATNNSTTTGVYLTKLRVRGRQLFKDEPIKVEARDAASVALYGESAEKFDMPYQGSSAIAQAAADYILARRKDPVTNVPSISFRANSSDALMTAALTLDVSSCITVTETVSGINRTYFINGVELYLSENLLVDVTWLLAPTENTEYWMVGEVGRSEMGETTVPGPF